MDNLAQEVELKGIAKKNNWLSEIDQQKITGIIETLKPLKDDVHNSTFVVNFKTLVNKILRLKFKNIIRSFYFHKLSKKLNLENIASEILKSKVKLTRIDHFWSPKSEEPVVQWHVDNAYSGRKNIKFFNKPDNNAIKFFFYLTDVTSDNGCLSYIPFSHKIAYALKDGIHKKKIQYQPYWTLSDFRDIILKEENYNYIKSKVDEKILIEFLEKSKLILEKKIHDHIFDQDVKKGGALIFDEAGMHRGSRTKFNDRMVLRFFYQKI